MFESLNPHRVLFNIGYGGYMNIRRKVCLTLILFLVINLSACAVYPAYPGAYVGPSYVAPVPSVYYTPYNIQGGFWGSFYPHYHWSRGWRR